MIKIKEKNFKSELELDMMIFERQIKKIKEDIKKNNIKTKEEADIIIAIHNYINFIVGE